jgi:hypothetical protein
MNLPKIEPIIWMNSNLIKKEVDKPIINIVTINKPEPQKYDQPLTELYLIKPLRPATGRLKELEDTFVRIVQLNKGKPTNKEDIIRLFDQFKRLDPNTIKLDELELLIMN